MALALLLLAVGAAGLVVGARIAVGGVVAVARAAGISTLPLALLLFGVHLETLSVTAAAAGIGETTIAAGAALGGVFVVLTAGLGFAALVAPGPIAAPRPAVVVAPTVVVAVAALAISDRFVGRLEGALLVALYAIYVFLIAVRPTARRDPDDAEEPEIQADDPAVREVPGTDLPAIEDQHDARSEGSLAPAGLASVGGLTLLVVGAVALVRGGGLVVDGSTLLPGFVGAAMVGALASAEQLAGTVASARRGRPEGRTLDLFATLGGVPSGALGVAALIRPLLLDSGTTVTFLALAFIYAVVGVTFSMRGRIGRAMGTFLVGCFAAWLLLGASL